MDLLNLGEYKKAIYDMEFGLNIDPLLSVIVKDYLQQAKEKIISRKKEKE